MQLYHGDCLEVTKQFPDNSIDMVLTKNKVHLCIVIWRLKNRVLLHNVAFTDLVQKMKPTYDSLV